MAVSQVYNAVPNDVITAARWNNEFGNIYNNGTAIAFPVTTGVSFAGFSLTLDNAGVTVFTSTSAVGYVMTVGAKSGVPGVGACEGQGLQVPSFTFTDSNTAGSGTAAEFSAVSIGTPTLAASNTNVATTDAATFYIQNAPANGTNETITNAWAIWVDSGKVRLDSDLVVAGALRALNTVEVLTSGTTWTVPALVTQVHVEIFGASGGGGGGGEAQVNAGAGGANGAAGTAGGTTSFNSGAYSTTGGGAGYGGTGGAGNAAGSDGAAHGVGSGGLVNRTGGGQAGGRGGEGGDNTANTSNGGHEGGNGGDGGYVLGVLTGLTPGASVTYAIGAKGDLGAGGTGGSGPDGGAGKDGQAGIIVLRY